MERYRVLVVDDSAFMRKIITDLIERDPKFSVVGTAENGLDAVMCIDQTKPDVITLDLEMPRMNGLEALQLILKKHKLPVIMLSGISEANTKDTIKALQYGAFDFIRKPTMVGAKAQDIHAVGEILLDKLRIAVLTRRKFIAPKPIVPKIQKSSNLLDNLEKNEPLLPKNDKIKANQKLSKSSSQTIKSQIEEKDTTKKVSKKPKPVQQTVVTKNPIVYNKSTDERAAPAGTESKNARLSSQVTSIVAIGTSTGGPRALHEVICSLPKDFPAPLVIVQHMPPRFTKSLAQRLDSLSQLDVYEAEEGMKLENGKAYIAPGGKHMKVTRQHGQYKIALSDEPSVNGHRPSVDVLFESLLDVPELERHIVLMTGMGSDGAQGMKKLADQGVASTIAEAEESCIVFGMPRSAIELGAANTVIPLTQIAPELIRVLTH